MQTKLTLRLEKALIQRAKHYSASSGKSLSLLVSDFFSQLDAPKAEHNLPPVTRSLLGALDDPKLDKKAYYKHLEDKHL
ncbi:MAG TPA: DUF6364 family protein [Gammaproteobacteria bacterium]|nr:DUF6364 family protein [Gammaproteobacteria bacterium]